MTCCGEHQYMYVHASSNVLLVIPFIIGQTYQRIALKMKNQHTDVDVGCGPR